MQRLEARRFWPLLAVGVGGLASVLNARFGYQMGLASSTFDAAILSAMSVGIEMMMWVLPVAAGYADATGHRKRARTAWFLWALCATWCFFSAVGYLALNRDQTASVHRDAVETRQTDKNRLTQIDAELGIIAVKPAPSWKEQRRRHELENERKTLTQSRRSPPAGDAQTALVARITGLSTSAADLAIAIAFGLVVLAISALGYFCVSIAPPKQREHVAVALSKPLNVIHVEEEEIEVVALPPRKPPPLALPRRW